MSADHIREVAKYWGFSSEQSICFSLGSPEAGLEARIWVQELHVGAEMVVRHEEES